MLRSLLVSQPGFVEWILIVMDNWSGRMRRGLGGDGPWGWPATITASWVDDSGDGWVWGAGC